MRGGACPRRCGIGSSARWGTPRWRRPLPERSELLLLKRRRERDLAAGDVCPRRERQGEVGKSVSSWCPELGRGLATRATRAEEVGEMGRRRAAAKKWQLSAGSGEASQRGV